MNERMNIRRMQIPEHADSSASFDAQKELTPEDWTALSAEIKENEQSAKWSQIAELAARAYVLDPRATVLSQSTETRLRDMYQMYLHEPEGNVTTDKMYKNDFMGNLCLLDKTLRQSIPPEFVQKIKDELKVRQRGMRSDMRLFLRQALLLRLVRPDEFIPNVDDAAFVQATMERLVTDVRTPHNIEVLALGHALGFNVRIPPDYFEDIRKSIKNTRVSKFAKLETFRLAMSGQILAADEVQISQEKGLELIRNEKDAYEKLPPSAPETLAI